MPLNQLWHSQTSPLFFKCGGGSGERAAAQRYVGVNETWIRTWWRPDSGGWGSGAVGPEETQEESAVYFFHITIICLRVVYFKLHLHIFVYFPVHNLATVASGGPLTFHLAPYSGQNFNLFSHMSISQLYTIVWIHWLLYNWGIFVLLMWRFYLVDMF